MAVSHQTDEQLMRSAIKLSRAGEGAVEPNPMVGCVIARDGQVMGQGFHEFFGGPHAEVNALASLTREQKENLRDATAFVTLEPCSHVGKTAPCADALVAAGVGRVVIAVVDPNPAVAGKGIERLRGAGVNVEVGLLEQEAKEVLAPYLTRVSGRPWVIAKWAMTVDGKIATRTGSSQWISNEESRRQVHLLRSRVDAVLVGIGTALADDPMLNARLESPPKRVATRVVIDSSGRLPLDSRLVKSAQEIPLLVATVDASEQKLVALEAAGCQRFEATSKETLPIELLNHLAKLGMTNVLVEGGAGLLGALQEQGLIDEVQVFIGPHLFGGETASGPIGGLGCATVSESMGLNLVSVESIQEDVYLVYRRKTQP